MTGFHNKRVYTADDNPFCKKCVNGEPVKGKYLLKKGAVICWCGGIPTQKKCEDFLERKKESGN